MLREVAAALDDPQHSGVAILGADGVGKTLLARSAAETSRNAPCAGWWAPRPSRPSRSAHSAPLLAGTDVADAARPAELLRAAQDRLDR